MAFDLTINGLKYRLNQQVTVNQLIEFFNCNKNAIAIEYNHVLLKQDVWAITFLNNQDNLEVVTIVGGG